MFGKYRKITRGALVLSTAAALIAAIGAGPASAAGSLSNAPLAVLAEQPAKSVAAANSAPQAAVGEPLHIVSVGDSLTVGYELGMTATSTPYGYVERVFEQALYHGRAEFKNYGILGLKTSGLSNFLKAAAAGAVITADEVQPNVSTYPLASETIAKTAQLAADLKKAELVTLTIGGNDFLPIFTKIQNKELSNDALQTELDTMLTDYVPQLEASLRSILGLNPKATVVFADQYFPVPKPSAINKAVTQEQYDILSGGVTKLKGLDEALAAKLTQEGYDVRTVDVSAPFKGNELAYTYILKGDIHPKQSGYDVMGRAFAQGIWGEYRDADALAAGVPLQVVVNGTALKGANKPVLKNNTTFLPMRDVAAALHATLIWDNKTQTATIAAGDKKVAFTIGAKTMKVNGETVPLETPAYLQQSGGNSYTYLPLAALSKGLGYQVEYRKPIATVFINA